MGQLTTQRACGGLLMNINSNNTGRAAIMITDDLASNQIDCLNIMVVWKKVIAFEQ